MTRYTTIARAVSGMRSPQIRLHPIDVARLFVALTPTSIETPDEKRRTDVLAGLARLAPLPSIPIVADNTVPRGQMRFVDRVSLATHRVSIDDLDDRRASELADLGAMSVERKP